jgi:hypothetical protein
VHELVHAHNVERGREDERDHHPQPHPREIDVLAGPPRQFVWNQAGEQHHGVDSSPSAGRVGATPSGGQAGKR